MSGDCISGLGDSWGDCTTSVSPGTRRTSVTGGTAKEGQCRRQCRKKQHGKAGRAHEGGKQGLFAFAVANPCSPPFQQAAHLSR